MTKLKSFKTWLETVNRDQARAFVMDAVGADQNDPKEQSDVLGSLIRHHPDIEHKIMAFSELQPYQSQIVGFIRASRDKTLQELVDFIEKIDNSGMHNHPNQIDAPTNQSSLDFDSLS